MKTDIVIGISNGDEAKAKTIYHLLKRGNFSLSFKFNGGANAGSTYYHNGVKTVAHIIPVAASLGIRSIIGPGCVLNIKSFFQELEELVKSGVDTSNIKIASNAHIVTQAHIDEEANETKIGTTKRGIGPAYRDKYNRTGIRAESCSELKEFLVDFHEEIFANPDAEILAQGAQSHYLDPVAGDYPYVTSSHCGVGGAIINGIPWTSIRNVYGVAKGYDTYVGAKKFQPDDDPVLKELGRVGREFGATTGRQRQCNYLNFDKLKKAVLSEGVSHLVVNKMDVIRDVDVYRMIFNGEVIDLKNEIAFKDFIKSNLSELKEIMFSYSPYEI